MKATTASAFKLLMEGSLSLARAEKEGIRVDVSYLEETHRKVVDQIATLTKELRNDPVWETWRKRFGEKSNLGSRPQLATVIFDCMGFPSLYQTEKGTRSTEPRAFKHVPLPFITSYFRLAKLQKIKSTYLEGIISEVCDGVLHPVYNLHTARSYRSSSSLINFQNLPIRDKEFGSLIRRIFIPRRGRRLVEVDFSAIEVRIAYCCHLDPVMRKYLLDPDTDMHRDTASDLFMLPKDQIEKRPTRDWAKNRFVFPEFYGSVYFQCAPHIWEGLQEEKAYKLPNGKLLVEHLSDKGIKSLGACDPKKKPQKGTFEYHVKEVERIFWEDRFTVFSQWKKRIWDRYCETGTVELPTGFVSGELMRRNQVLNLPIQGPAFHCLLQSFIWLTEEIKATKMRSRLVGQIHDSALADVPENEVQDYLNLAHEITSERLEKEWDWIVIPLETESEVCDGPWNEKKVWVNRGGEWGPVKK
jgi:DNA polymerase-1